MLCMVLDEDAEVVGEQRALHYLETGEMVLPIFTGDLGEAEAIGFFNVLEILEKPLNN